MSPNHKDDTLSTCSAGFKLFQERLTAHSSQEDIGLSSAAYSSSNLWPAEAFGPEQIYIAKATKYT